MIDFACKQFRIEEVIKCSLGMTKADAMVFRAFLADSTRWMTADDVAATTRLNLSTVQRAVKKLHEKGVLARSQQNLGHGGYQYVYQAKPKPEIRRVIRNVIDTWATTVKEHLETW